MLCHQGGRALEGSEDGGGGCAVKGPPNALLLPYKLIKDANIASMRAEEGAVGAERCGAEAGDGLPIGTCGKKGGL